MKQNKDINEDELQKFVEIAKNAVKDQPEPFKSSGFEVILNNLLNREKSISSQMPETTIIELPFSKFQENKQNFVTKCGISLSELDDIVSFDESGKIEFVLPISGSDARKHMIVSICMIAIKESIFEEEWVKASPIVDCLRSLGVKDLANFSYTLKKYPNLIRMRGSRGKGKEYKLTSGEGRQKAYDIFRQLVHDQSSLKI